MFSIAFNYFHICLILYNSVFNCLCLLAIVCALQHFHFLIASSKVLVGSRSGRVDCEFGLFQSTAGLQHAFILLRCPQHGHAVSQPQR